MLRDTLLHAFQGERKSFTDTGSRFNVWRAKTKDFIKDIATLVNDQQPQTRRCQLYSLVQNGHKKTNRIVLSFAFYLFVK